MFQIIYIFSGPLEQFIYLRSQVRGLYTPLSHQSSVEVFGRNNYSWGLLRLFHQGTRMKLFVTFTKVYKGIIDEKFEGSYKKK